MGHTIKGKQEIEFYAEMPGDWKKYDHMIKKLPRLEVLGRGIDRLEK